MRCGLLLPALALLLGCSDRPELSEGETCELNTDCTTPLVCRLDKCRLECRLTRDCPFEQACLRDRAGLGACQVEAEVGCLRDGDCTMPLVCAFGQCRNECATRRDCPGGAVCLNDPVRGNACVDPAGVPCERSSQCDPLLECGVDGRCREQCVEDRDCRTGSFCDVDSTPNVCLPRPDAGPPDGGAADAGPPDAGTPDTGAPDSGV